MNIITDINPKNVLTDIELNEDIIIEAIHELSPNSAAGPDCVQSSLLTNCTTEIAALLLLIFSHSLSLSWGNTRFLEEIDLPLFKFTNLAIKLSQVITVQFL